MARPQNSWALSVRRTRGRPRTSAKRSSGRWCTAVPAARVGTVDSLAFWRLVAPYLSMTSRVHPKYKTKYHVGNGPEYARALVQRGDVTVWLSADATDAWKPSPAGRPGGQRRFSDLAIEPALTLRLVFRLPWRQTEGFLRSVLAFLGSDLDAPDHTTLSRRSLNRPGFVRGLVT